MSSSSSVVATAGPIDSTPKGPAINVFFIFHGGRYRTHQQHNPGVPPSMSSTYLVVATARPAVSTARGPPLMSSSTSVVATVELACHTPGGPPSTSSSTLVVAAVGRVGSNPQGGPIDVFLIFGGGSSWTGRQHPPTGPAIDVFFNFGGGHYRTRRQHSPGGPP
jgi:hypothetical protein